MKHLLNGVAIAATLAIAFPALAQNAPMTPGAPQAPAAAPAAPNAGAPAKPTASKQRHHRRPMRSAARRGGRAKMSAGNQMTEQLNREELARIQGGGAAPPPAMPAAPGPRPSGR